MNAIYKVIWNDAIRQYQVVNELCRSRRKACSVKAVHTDGFGRSLKRSVLATAAAVAMMAGGAAYAADITLGGLEINVGSKNTSNVTNFDQDQLPQNGDTIVIDIDNTNFAGLSDSIFNQDENQGYFTIFTYDGDTDPQNLSLAFKQNGVTSQDGFQVNNAGLATFSYSGELRLVTGGEGLARFVLTNIDLLSTAKNGQYINVSAKDEGATTPDLKASLTGSGNVTFGFSEPGSHGYLTLAGEDKNAYSGRTFVGFTSDGNKSASPTTLYFGKTEAFGDTLNLDVESDSEVFISGESKTEDYFQRVHGLQGEGLIDLGTRANLELAQSGKTTGNYDDAEGVIRIDNKFTGSGNTTDPASGAWFDIKLSSDVAGDIVRFSNDASDYTGVIALTDATIEGYDANRKLDLNGGTYSPNKILTTSTLRLESGGQLLIDGTSVDSLYNLVLNNNQGWTDGGNNRNALAFKNVQLGEAALNVTGKLTLESDGTVSIDNLTDGGLEGAVSGKSFFDADNGLENALIVVSGGIVTNGHELALDGKIKGESGTDVMQGNDHVADAHWKFDDKLVFEDGATSDSFNIRYTLTQIDILDGKTFTLSTEENSATSGQDFSALISGSGDLKVDASGYTVNIGHSGGNTFTGDTEVTDGTNVILTENSGFGTGSGTLTIAGSGSVTLGTGVKQSGSGLSGTGSLVLGSGAEYALTQNSDANITNKIDGSGTLKVDLGSSDHELTFGSTNPFSGWLDLTNGSLNLSKNADALSTSNIILGDNTNFTFGSGSKVESLTVTGNADLKADTLIIGGDAVLTVNGALSFDSGRSFDVSNVVVADSINLIDFDGGLVDNKFITAGSVTNAAGDSFGIKVADEDANTSGQQVVRNYTQGGTDPVAETTWTIGSDIAATGTALNAQVQLTKIDILDGKSLSIAGGASAQKELVAQLSSKSASGSIVFTGGSILVSNSSNDYQVATRIENGTTVTLGASNSLGHTSELANYGSLVIGQGITQTVTGWDQVASGSIALDGSLTLDQTGGQTIANSFTGDGTFSVDLGGSGNELVFSNTGALTGFTGKLSLSNLLFDVANSTNYSSMLGSTDIALNGGAVFNADASGSIHTGDFTFNGGTLKVGDIEASNNTGAKVSVSGGIVISSDSTIEVEGVKLEGTSNILAADDGIKQTIAEFTGSISGSLDDLLVTGVGTSEIRNASTDENPAAYGVWSAGDIAQGNKTLDVELTLQEIQLADATNGLKLNASGPSTDTTLSATITNYGTTAGKIVFEGGDITIGGSGANTYTGETEVTGGTVTLAKDSGFGNTLKLSIASGAAVDFGGKNQTVGALEVGSKEDEASNALSGSGTLTLGTGQTGASHIWGSNSFTGTIQLAANHNLAINSVAGIGGTATVGLGDNSVLTIDGATGGTFSTHLSGAGTVAVANSTFDVSGNNTAFTGTWQLGSSGNVSVSGTSTDIDNALGSGATLSFSSGSLSLKLAAGESALTIDEVLSGAGSVTLGSSAYENQSSEIKGEHSGFTADVTLANGHKLTLNDTLGIGNTGTVALGADTTLVINDALGGSFTKTVSGADGSNIQLSGSGIGIYADNSGYLGDWSLTSGTTASVSGSSTVGVDSILGRGGTVALGTNATLALSQDSGSIVVDNVFAGAGTLVVSGTSDQEFGFSTNWTDAETSGFTGTLRLEDGIKMTVGGGSGSGFYNAANLANADFKLESGSTLVVATQTGSRVNTFDNLNVNSGTISFAGNFDLGATTEELGQLQVGSLTGSGNIALTIPDANGTVDQTIGQNELLTIDDDSHFQALITAETGTVSESGWTLNGSTTTSGSGLRQAVRNAGDTETVAHAIYDYALATGKVNSESDSLGIEYTLKKVDIVDAMTLELSASGKLSAVITDRSGAGTLLITGQIKLTGQNEYDSVTQVSGAGASLTVGSSGLGNTTALLLESGASFINEGINSAGYLNASGSTIKLDEALTLTGGNVSKIAGGTITGNGALNVQDNQLQVSGVVTDGYFTGNVNLGDGNNAAILELKGVAGIGKGSVNFVSDRSNVYVRGNGTDGTTLTNTYSGGGQITVHLSGSGNVFDFSQNQANGAFTGTLVLQEAGYNLYDDDGDLASATLLTSGGGYVTVNAGSDIADHKVDGLSLYGGTLDFGLMTEGSKSGQIVVGSEGFATNASTTVVKVALGENNNATGSDVFDLNSDLSVLLIEGEGFDATGRDLTSLDFSGSANVVQQVKQSGRFADGSATAELTYSNGHLVGNKEGIGASWTLSQINLLSGNGDVLSGSGEGFLIDASNESSQSGTISALITGKGSIEFAGGTITLNNSNDYTGNTYVTDGELVLAADEALGDSALLKVTGSGTVSVEDTAQSIGSISVAGENGLSMGASGSLTLTSGASTISSANNDVSGTVALSGRGTTLTIQNASGVGGDGTTISLGDDTSVIFAGAGFAGDVIYATINNELRGSGTVQIGNGTDKMYLELLNKDNAFGKLLVTSGATVLVNDLNADNALGDAAVDIQSGGIARLHGSSGWTITNDLTLVKDGELELSAGGGVVNFAGTPQQNISGGKVTLQTSVLYLGGSSGAANAAVLDTAHLNVGSNGVLHVATGNDAQVLDKLTLGSSGHIWFDGTLGVSGTGTTQLGQLKVGSLGDMKGTIHLTASSAAGSGGEIKAAELLNVADNGSFQSLIEVTGTDTITDAELSGTNLDVSGNTSVVSDIKDGSGNTVAEGTFGFGDTLVAKDDKYAGVQYELQLIKLLKTLEISESGSLDVRISGSGNLLVSNALTLTNKEGQTNDYTGSTTVAGTGSLVAGAGALGKTSALNVSGSFTNSGDNTVGIFDLSGSAVLNEGTTLTVLGTTSETNDFTGTLTGSGSLALESGETVVSQNNSGYAGNVVLGKDGGLDAEIHFNAGASLGNGTITFAGSKSKLSVDASGATTLTNKLDLSAAGGEIVVSGDGDDTFAFHADQAASGFGAGSKLTLTGMNYSFTTAGNDVLDNVALSVTSGTLTVNGDADLSDRSVYGLSLTDAVVDFGKLGNGDGVLDLEHQNLTIGGSSGSTTVRLDSEFQSVESDTGSAAFMQGGSLTLIRDASNDFSGDLSKLKLELDGAASAGTAIEQAVIQNNVETARLEGTAQGFGAVQGEDDGLWDLNLNLSFTTLRINKDRTFTVSEGGDIGLVITDNGADAAGGLSITGGASVQLLETNSYHGETSVSSGAELILLQTMRSATPAHLIPRRARRLPSVTRIRRLVQSTLRVRSSPTRALRASSRLRRAARFPAPTRASTLTSI